MGNIMDFDRNVVTSSILKITDFSHYPISFYLSKIKTAFKGKKLGAVLESI